MSKFDKLITTMKDSIFHWGYFVDFNKVHNNVKQIEKELNILNFLLGKTSHTQDILDLIIEYPNIRKALPLLIAVRRSKLNATPILTNGSTGIKSSIFFDDCLDDDVLHELKLFIEDSGLINIFKDGNIKNLVDYCTGVEVGLDSNARKNRTGQLMEDICFSHLSDMSACDTHLIFLDQVTKSDIKRLFNIDVKTNIDSIKNNQNDRRFDYIIYNEFTKKLYVFEANYYSSSGSKPNSIAREYRDLYDLLDEQDIEFIWLTDGLGWNQMKNALEQTVNHNKWVVNLSMLEDGILNKILKD